MRACGADGPPGTAEYRKRKCSGTPRGEGAGTRSSYDMINFGQVKLFWPFLRRRVRTPSLGEVDTGDIVADFELPDQDGRPRRLSALLTDGPVVLFFYPAAMTKGCTAESCHFRDLGAEFAGIGAQRVGISTDSVAKQKEFSELHGFDYPLLSDESGDVARTFGVKRRFGPLPVKRQTFVIGTDRQVAAVISSEFSMDKHADEALRVLATLPR
jgi:peroxiredoxin Q/BCP